jgi:hypothetical protein
VHGQAGGDVGRVQDRGHFLGEAMELDVLDVLVQPVEASGASK